MLNHELRPLLLTNDGLQQLILEEYGVHFESAILLKDNFNFVFATEKLILRFSPATKKSIKEITAELRWTQFLNKRRLSVNLIVPAKSGALHLTVKVATETIYLVVFERSLGAPIDGQDMEGELFTKIGELTGQLHQASIQFQPQVDSNFPHWNQQSKCACLTVLPHDQRNLPEILKQLNLLFEALPQEAGHYGVIHYDIHQGNYFLLKDAPNTPLFLFDFEMTCLGWYLQDIAVILYYASNYHAAHGNKDRAGFEDRFLKIFSTAYQKYMPEVVFDKALIQAHLLYRDLFVYSYVLDAWQGRELSEGDHRFIRQLEGNLAARSAEQGYL